MATTAPPRSSYARDVHLPTQVTVRLPADVWDVLQQLAQARTLRPAQMARLLIVESLKRNSDRGDV